MVTLKVSSYFYSNSLSLINTNNYTAFTSDNLTTFDTATLTWESDSNGDNQPSPLIYPSAEGSNNYYSTVGSTAFGALFNPSNSPSSVGVAATFFLNKETLDIRNFLFF